DAKDDLARLREFQGVADQVHEDLAQPRRIPADGGGHTGADVVGELEALLAGAEDEGGHRLVQGASQVEVHSLQIQFPGLDLGEVEDVVDEAEQGVGGY